MFKKLKSFVLFFIVVVYSLISCKLASSFNDINLELMFDKDELNIDIGEVDLINLTVSENQNKESVIWEYDEEFIFAKTDSYSAIITAVKTGTTVIKAHCGNASVACVVNISDIKYKTEIVNPYVYASTDIVEIKPLETTKISAALFGGTPADNNGYSWTIDNTSVASIAVEGNYCWITGLSHGQAKLTLKHTKAVTSYSIIINCVSDGTELPYLTTENNVISIDKSELEAVSFSVKLNTKKEQENYQNLECSIIDMEDKVISDLESPISIIDIDLNNISIKAIKSGVCKIRITHPLAKYPLDVLVRVLEKIEPIILQTDNNFVSVTNEKSSLVKINAINVPQDKPFDSSLLSFSFDKDVSNIFSYEIVDDTINIKGVNDGNVKVTVSYPDAIDCSFIVVSRNLENKKDACTFITTTQTYITLNKDSEEQLINVILKNGTSEDLQYLKWTITNIPNDSTKQQVINWKSGDGSSETKTNARTLVQKQAAASAIIEPVNTGLAYIDISHPDAMFETRITVVVVEPLKEKIESFLNYVDTPILELKNGESKTIKVSLTNSSSEQDIQWTSDNSKITLSSNLSECVVTAPAEGNGPSKSVITVKHPQVEKYLTFTVLCYDTRNELSTFDDIKYLYTTETFFTLDINNSKNINIFTTGWKDTLPTIKIDVKEGSELLQIESSNNNQTLLVTGIASGKAVVEVSCDECEPISLIFQIKDNNIIYDEKACYLSTTQNVVYFENESISQDIQIDLHNISTSVYHQTVYELSNANFEFIGNNNIVSIKPLVSEGTSVLSVKHPLSENVLEINLVVGERYQIDSKPFSFIQTDTDTLELFIGQDEVSLYASLVINTQTSSTESTECSKGFIFEVENKDIIDVTSTAYSNFCNIIPKTTGITKIKISHKDAVYSKEVVVIVNPSADLSTEPYITTENNVVTILTGDFATINASIKNLNDSKSNEWTWTCLDNSMVNIVGNNGSSIMISGLSPGTTKIKVRNSQCIYSIEIIVIVLDPTIIKSNPYIKISDDDSIITLKKGESTTVVAEMIGGNEADINYFKFVSSDSSIAITNAASNSTLIKAVESGICNITVYNTNYLNSYSRNILIIVEEEQIDGVYIKPSQSIVKLSPTDEVVTLSVELVGADPAATDNLIWWADDYNLISINGKGTTCSIVPTGKSGSTKIHIKHENAKKQCDILVLVSNYDTFSFGVKSASIIAEKIYFYPLQIPATDENYKITYESSNENVCIIDGSNAVAYVCGVNPGSASVKANFVSEDGTILDSSEILISVNMPNPNLPTLTLGNVIYTGTVGENHTLKATLSGSGINPADTYDLKWTIKDNKAGISFFGNELQHFGPDCFVSFEQPDEYVVECSYENVSEGIYITAEVYINVLEKNEVGIKLSSALETIYKDDGSLTLSAELINGTKEDEKNISWSALKVGGENIVSVSKQNGATCTVSPKKIGQTTVIARLPNGNTATCIIIVRSSVEIHFSTGTIRVNPGYTEELSYRTVPENAAINWIAQMNSTSSSLGDQTVNYFTYEVDSAAKKIRITGLKNNPNGVAGTLTGFMMGASAANIPKLNVYVQYNVELSVTNSSGSALPSIYNNEPDTKNTREFYVMYYPKDLDIDIFDGDTKIACIAPETSSHGCTTSKSDLIDVISTEKEIYTDSKDGKEKVKLKVVIAPKLEGTTNIKVEANLPLDTARANKVIRNISYNAYYEDYDIQAFFDLIPDNAFTYYDGNTIHLSDGEEISVYFKIMNENAKGKILDIDSKYWLHNGNTELELNNNIPSSRESVEKNKNVFDLETPEKDQVVDKDNNIINPPNAGLVSLTSKNVEDKKIYTIKHNYDYFFDINKLFDGKSWEEYKNTEYKIARNNYGHTDTQGDHIVTNIYNEDLITDLQNKGVKYWVVNREMCKDSKYMTKHINTSTPLIADWRYYIHQKKEDFRDAREFYGNSTIALNSSNNTKIFEYRKKRDNRLNNHIMLFNYDYEPCKPYVITTEELNSNNFYVRPKEVLSYNAVGWNSFEKDFTQYNKALLGDSFFRVCREWNQNSPNKTTNNIYREYHDVSFEGNPNWDTWFPTDSQDPVWEHEYLPKLLHRYVYPTTYKLSDKNEFTTTGKVQLTIPYETANDKKIKEKVVNITFEKRMCEAYSNIWYKKNVNTGNGYKDRWYLNSNGNYEKDPDSILDDYFTIDKNNILVFINNGTINKSDCTFNYQVIPPEANVSVEVPSSLICESHTSSVSGRTKNGSFIIKPSNMHKDTEDTFTVKYTDVYGQEHKLPFVATFDYNPQFYISKTKYRPYSYGGYGSSGYSVPEGWEISIKSNDNNFVFDGNDSISFDCSECSQTAIVNEPNGSKYFVTASDFITFCISGTRTQTDGGYFTIKYNGKPYRLKINLEDSE